jgi:DNA excision repair protein ERCC-3
MDGKSRRARRPAVRDDYEYEPIDIEGNGHDEDEYLPPDEGDGQAAGRGKRKRKHSRDNRKNRRRSSHGADVDDSDDLESGDDVAERDADVGLDSIEGSGVDKRRRKANGDENNNVDDEAYPEFPSNMPGGDEFDLDDDAASGDMRDFSSLKLKPDHETRPVWVSADRRILLETFSPIYKQAYDFLVAIAEPVSRPEFMHEYRLTAYALYAAVSVGLDAESIIRALRLLCKTDLPPEVPAFIRAQTRTYGKTKLVLKKGRYFVQTHDEQVLRKFLSDSVIAHARVAERPVNDPADAADNADNAADGVVLAGGEEAVSDAATLAALTKALDADDDEDDEEDNGASGSSSRAPKGGMAAAAADAARSKKKEYDIEIMGEEVEHVKRRAIELEYPLMEEYDFRNDTVNPSIDIDLRPIAKIRPYQEKSLEKMFGNGRARSGVIVLPCGAGKSLVGVTAACTIKKPTLCLCTSSVSVEQWRYQFSMWSTIPRDKVGRFIASGGASSKDKSFAGGVTVTTYSMISHSGRRAKESQRMLDELKSQEWGLLLLDEVHVVPANVFRRVIGVIKSHCKLGLTATLLREDEKIGDINFLIGPKLYEANWLDLQRANYLATVQCAEVWCPMTKEFYREYLANSAAKRKLLYAMNPNKFRMTQYLVQFHERRGDKVIIFADNIYALRMYALRLNRPFIYGPTTQTERLRILDNFQHNPQLGTILLSKVGDTSIDIPEANVLIQVSSHYGSRRQEAQRLGRILRPKRRAGQNFNAFFYSLVSTDTQEMYYSSKRQQFLIDQGYAFKVITQLDGMDKADPPLDFSSKEEQLELLAAVLAADESEATETLDIDAEEREFRMGGGYGGDKGDRAGVARRNASSIAALTGARGIRYSEFNRVAGAATQIPKSLQVVQHSLFRKRAAGGFKKQT